MTGEVIGFLGGGEGWIWMGKRGDDVEARRG